MYDIYIKQILLWERITNNNDNNDDDDDDNNNNNHHQPTHPPKHWSYDKFIFSSINGRNLQIKTFIKTNLKCQKIKSKQCLQFLFLI